jgi:hypothetical protein
MRMSWFTSLRAGRRRKGKRQQLTATPLRVRQLERRRVLDGAAASVVVSTVVVADVGQSAPVATSTANATDAPPIVVPAPSPAANNSIDAAHAASFSPGQGLAGNVPPVLVVATNQQVNEGQTLNLSASGGAPPLALYIDPDLADTHTATVDWGDGSAVQNGTIIAGVGAGAIGGTHVYADDGTYTVTVSVADNNGGSASQAFNVLVKNVPPVLVTAADQTVNEGAQLNLSAAGGAPPLGLFVDPGVLDTHTATVDWGDGSPTQNTTVIEVSGTGALGGTHTYADDGSYTVTVTVKDDDGGTTSGTFKVTVQNVAPFVDLTGPTTVDEGSPNNWNLGPVVDPGTDTVTQYVIHWGDGNTDTFTAAQIAGMSNTVGHTYADGPNNYTIAVDLVDEDGTFTSVDTLNVTVKNVAPFVDLTGPTTVNEGSPNSWNLGPVVDPGTDTVSQYVIHWGDGNTDTFTAAQIAGMSGTVGHTYADGPNNYTISLDLADEDGTYLAVDTLAVAVNNVPPVVDITGPTVVNEGAPNNWILGAVTDPGTDTVSQYVIHWGDGNTDTFTAAQIAGMSNAVSYTYADGPNNYTIAVDLVDEDGTFTSVDTLNVTVNNVAPFVDLTGPTNVNEGAPNTWNLGPVVDPGTDTVTQYVIHWGDGNTNTFTAAQIAGMSNAVGHTYVEGPNNYTISVDLVDEDGTFLSVDTLNVTVNNVAPTVSLNAPSDIAENGVATLTGSYTDIGVQDAHTVTVNWADSNNGSSSTFTVSAIQDSTGTPTLSVGNTFSPSTDGAILTVTSINATTGQVGFSVQHQYLDDGLALGNNTNSDPSLIGVTVADDDGGSGNNTTTLTVHNVKPSVALNSVADISENGVATVTGSFTDIGLLDAHVVTVNWNDPNSASASTFAVSAIQNAAGTATLQIGNTFASSTDSAVLTITSINAVTGQVGFSVGHQYLDDGLALGNNTADDTSTIGVTVADDDAESGSSSATVKVHDVTPSVALNSVVDISENGSATLTGSYTDIGRLDAHTVAINWGDPNNGLASTFAVGAIQNAAGTATLHVGDTINSSTDSAVLTITSINATTGQVGFSVQHQYLDDGLALGNNTTSDSSTIGVTVADDDTQSVNGSTTVVVHDVAPSVALNSVPNISENGVATLTGSYTDIGKLDAHTLTVDWDDPNNSLDSTFAVTAIQNAAGAATLHVGDTFNSSTDSAVLTITSINAATGQVGFSVQHQYLDDGLALGNNTTSDTSTIGVTIADDDAQSGNSTTTVNVQNVAPGVALNAVPDISENGVVTLTGNYSDIGLLDAHTVTVAWGDANNGHASTFAVSAIENAAGTATLHVGDTFNSSTDSAILTVTSINAATGQVGFSVMHQYLDDGLALGNNTVSDTSIIGVTVADDDAQSGNTTTSVIVHNVTPAVALNAVPDISENGVATVAGSYTDIGLLDAHTVTVNWADPNNGAASTFAVNAIQNAAGTATLSVGNTFSSSTDSAVLTVTSINAVTGQVGFSVQHQYLDDGLALGNNTVSDVSNIGVTVADDDAQSGFGNATVTVHNVAPAVALNSVTDINENGVATLTGSYTDIGLLDAHTVTVSWADPNNGLASTFAVGAIQNAAGTATLHVGDTFSSSTDSAVLTIASINAATGQVGFSVQHQYLDDGLALGNNTISDVSNIGVTVADDDAQSGNNTTTVTVHNVTPGVALNAVPDINENGVATLTGSYTDIGLLDAHTVTVNWADPNNASASTFAVAAIQNAAGTATLHVGDTFNSSTDSAVLTVASINTITGQVGFSVQHQYLDDGLALGNNTISDTSIIGVTVADDDAQSGSTTTSVIVHNVTPAVALNSVADINENGVATLTGSYTDIGLLDAHTVTVGWADPNNSSASTFAVTAIRNAAGTATLNVGDTFNSSTDAAVLTITSINSTTGQVSVSVQHQYLDDGLALGNNTISDTSTIGVTVADDDAQSGNNTTSVTVHNVTPSVALNSVTDINENGVATVTGSYTDIGLLDAHTVTVNWADPNNGSASTFAVNAIRNAAGTATLHVGDTFNSSTDSAVLTITTIDATTGQVGFTVQHQYLDDGLALGNNTISDVSIIGVTVADDDAQSGSNTTSVTVHNVSPTVALNTVTDINENGTATLTGTYTDIGLLDAHTLTVDWDDPNNGLDSTFAVNAIQNAAGTATLHVGDTFNSSTDSAILTITSIDATTGQVGYSVQHQYLDDGLALGNNTASDLSTIGVTVADDDAQSGSNTVTFTVHNVAPAVVLNTVPDINENGVATLTGNFTDIGKLDAHTVTVDWDDPNNSLDSTFAVTAIQNAAGTATLHIGDTFSSSTDSAILTITSIDTTTGQVGFSVQHQYLDDGLALGNNTASDVSTVGVTVADDDTQSGSQTATVTVHNVTPAVALNAVPDINENGTATLTGSYTDIGLLDAHVLTVNWADANNALASTFAVSAIRNAAGTATLSVGDTFASSTDTAVLTITAIDATTGQVSFSVQHQYLDDGLAPGNGTTSDVSIIGVTVMDDDTQTGSNTTTVTVNNVAPAYLNVTGDSIDEGHVGTISLNVDDPGTLDVFTFNVDWRDGSTATIPGLGATDASGTVGSTNFTWTASTRQLTLSHLYADNANYQVVVRMADDDMAANFAGAPGAGNFVQQTTQVAVANLAPTLAGTTNLMVDEGSAVTLVGLGVHIEDLGFDNPSNQTPPPLGNLTTEEFVAASIDWGDGFSTTPVNIVNRVSGAPTSSTTATLTTADFMHAAHYYADDGTYTVTVRMADDNMGAFSNPALFQTGVAGVDYVDRQFTIVVKNVTPTLGITSVASQQQTGAGSVTTTPITPATTITVNESGTVSLAASFTDPGFSLDPNPAAPAGTSFPKNEIFRYYINWGDNRETIGEGTAADVASIVNGGPTVLTSGAFDTSGMIHTYADDGTYTVTVRLADDNMGAFADTSKFATGVGVGFGTDSGGDFVETKFTVVVNNIAPSFVPQPGGANVVGTQVTSGGFTTINVAFSDPGFDNTANLNSPAPPTITDTLHESFTHVIDWGDGTVDAVHTYTDSSTHDVTITQTGPGGTQTFTVPAIGAGNVLTLVSSQDINNPGVVAQPYTYVVNWGDGNVQTITLMLKTPGAPTVNGQTMVGSLIRTSGNVGVATTGSFGITHQYLGPPDPLNPTADIKITVSVVDDNDASVTDFTTITNPGINTFNVYIDTTPNVPRLELAVQQQASVFLNEQSAAPSSLQPPLVRVARSELTATSDRYLELVVVTPDGNETERYRLSDEALVDLRGLFSTLPDNRYKIFLIRTDNNSRRLVMDVFVRHGRVIDPSDDSEGTRDRPPTAEGTQHKNVQQNNVPQNNGKQNGAPQPQAVPLQNNPLLKRVPDAKAGAANESGLPAIGPTSDVAQPEVKDISETQPTRSRGSMKWALPLAGLGLVASRESWSERLGAALETADDEAWQRLRRAGRLGRSGDKSGDKSGRKTPV